MEKVRKNNYKLRKIGRFNYSLTIPSTMVDYLGGYDSDKHLYLHCKNGNIIISNNNEISNKHDIRGWRIEFNSLIPFIRNNNYILGFDMVIQSYFCNVKEEQFYGSLENCVAFMNKYMVVPSSAIKLLSNYVKENKTLN